MRNKIFLSKVIILVAIIQKVQNANSSDSQPQNSDEEKPNFDDQRPNAVDEETNKSNIELNDKDRENIELKNGEIEKNATIKTENAKLEILNDVENPSIKGQSPYEIRSYGDELVIPKFLENDDHKVVSESNVYPYVVSILQKYRLLSTGALISSQWVLTAADSLFVIRETSREIRVRLGCTDYKKGGIIIPVKYFEIHPYFDDELPEYDIAMIKLAEPVHMTSSIRPTRIQDKPQDVAATHFIVTSWPMKVVGDWLSSWNPLVKNSKKRSLQVSHQHPGDWKRCSEYLASVNVTLTDNMMCLDPSENSNPCMRDVGAPVVLNGVLWGVVSSWVPEDCENDLGPILMTKVSADEIRLWIESLLKEKPWKKMGSKSRDRKYNAS